MDFNNDANHAVVAVTGVYALTAAIEVISTEAGSFQAQIYVNDGALPRFIRQELTISNVTAGSTREGTLAALGQFTAGSTVEVFWQSTAALNPPANLLHCNFAMHLLYAL